MIAVLMSTRNMSDVVGEAIWSILSQTYKDFILYIIDDDSNDNTFYIIHKERELDNRITMLQNNAHKNLSSSLNFGLAVIFHDIIRYEFIARHDADDVSSLDRFEKQVNFLRAHPEIDILGSQYRNKEGRIIERPQTNQDISQLMLKDNYIPHGAVMVRPKVFETFRYDEDCTVAQDWELWIRCCKHGFKFANLPDCLYWKKNDRPRTEDEKEIYLESVRYIHEKHKF